MRAAPASWIVENKPASREISFVCGGTHVAEKPGKKRRTAHRLMPVASRKPLNKSVAAGTSPHSGGLCRKHFSQYRPVRSSFVPHIPKAESGARFLLAQTYSKAPQPAVKRTHDLQKTDPHIFLQ
jgi:hypothetical protein